MKNGFIKANIECKKGENNIPEDLIELIGVEYEWRPCMFRMSDVQLYYPDHSGNHTCIDVEDGYYRIKEPFETIVKLMEE